LLNHADVADACVVGIPEEFSGEIPLAFVTLSTDARARVQHTPAEAGKIKKALADVSLGLSFWGLREAVVADVCFFFVIRQVCG
jgi:acyl-CoA synthetase (AMP-forming)/AMP-acid ligase II